MTPQEVKKREENMIALIDEQIMHLRKINICIMQTPTFNETHFKILNGNISQIIALLKTVEDYV